MIEPLNSDPPPRDMWENRRRVEFLHDLPAEHAPAGAAEPGEVILRHQYGSVIHAEMGTDLDGNDLGPVESIALDRVHIVHTVPAGSVRFERLAAEARRTATGEEN